MPEGLKHSGFNPDSVIEASIEVLGAVPDTGLILSAVIFLGSLLAFRLLFREQRWSASTRHRATLLLFLVLVSRHSDLDGLPANANQ